MSTPSVRASVYSSGHLLVNGDQADRMQSARMFNPALNSVSNIVRESNELYAGRPAHLNSGNGSGQNSLAGFSGLNPQSYIMNETGLRQVDFRSDVPNTSFYDTIDGANRANWPVQYAGTSGSALQVPNGPESYTNVPKNSDRQLTSVERKRYLAALHKAYKDGQF